jgi:predicted RND superfamily exporter protein
MQRLQRASVESVLVFARRHATFVFGIAIVAFLSGVLLVSRVSFDADILRLLPQRSPSVRDFQLFLRDFGSLDHLYVVFSSAGAIGDHGDLVDRYVDALRHAPEIESVDAQLFEPGKDWSYLSDRELYLLGADGAAAALARFRSPQLDGEIAHARDLLSMPSARIKAFVQQDPLGLLTMLRDRMGREKGFTSFDPTQDGYVSPDGRSRLVMVKPKGAPFDTDFCKALFDRLSTVEAMARREAAAEDPDAGEVEVQAAGAYRVSLEAEQLIRRETTVNSIGSLVLLLLVVFAVFRTPWVMLYGSAPLALAAVLTLGLNGLIRGSLSPATSGSAGMLFGLGIDGVVLIYLRYLEERRRGASADEAVRGMSGTASSVILAQATTAATFLALLFIDFPTLQDLGSLVGLGILLCCGLTLLLLPALLPRGRDARSGRGLTAAWLGRFVTRAARPIVWVSAVATIGLAAASTRLHLDTSIDRLQAQTRGAALESELADRFSLPRDVLLVLDEHDDIEPLLEADARLERALAAEAPSVVASGIGVLLPSAREQAGVAQVIRGTGTTSAGARRDIEAAAARTGFRPDTFVPFLEHVPRLLDPGERISYDGLMTHGLESIVSRFLVRRDGRYQAVTYLYPQQAVDIDELRRIVREVDPGLRLTGLRAIDHDLRRQFFPDFLKGIGIGAVAVALLIYLVFRTVRHTLLALAPTAVGFVWSAGLLALVHVELDLFSLFAAVTFIGIAVDYGIYVLYRYVFEPPSDMEDVMTKTGAAIIIACVTALIGFGTLVNSSYGPLHVFGIVSIVTLTCCLTASIVSLPALVLEMERWSRSAR